MTTELHRTEKRLHRMAARQGRRLVKTHVRDPRSLEYGKYFLLWAGERAPAYTGKPRPGALTLQEVEEALYHPLAQGVRMFPVGLLEEWDIPHNGIEQQSLDRSRWYEVLRCVFRAPDDGQVWGVTYCRGLTERQDVEPFERSEQDGLVAGVPMEQRPVTEVKWVVK